MESPQNHALTVLATTVKMQERALTSKIECCQALQTTIRQMRNAEKNKLALLGVELQYHLALLDWHIHGISGGSYEEDVSMIKEMTGKALTPAQPN